MKFFKKFKRNNQGLSKPVAFQTGRAGALLAAKPKRTLFTVLAAVLCCVCAVVVGSFTGTNYASAASQGNKEAILLSEGNTIIKNNLRALYRLIGGSSVNTLSLLSNKVKTKTVSYNSVNSHYALTSKDIRDLNDYNLQVSFGGYDWIITYVSFDSSGNLIATMMMADSDKLGTMAFAGFASSTYTGTYVSNIYSSSYVRSFLVGSTYATGVNTCTSIAPNNSTFKTFLPNFSKYLVAPSQMPWQKGIQSMDTTPATVTLLNECWDAPMGTTKYVNTQSNLYTGTYAKANISDWRDDKIWLPAMAEIGTKSDAGANGIWESDYYIRKATKKYWLRTGTQNTNYKWQYARGMSTTGEDIQGAKVTASGYYVRPCVHLNLTALENAGTVMPETPYWTTSQANYYRYSDNILYGSYTGVAETATMYEPAKVGFPSYSGFSNSTSSGTTRTVIPTSANVAIDTSASSDGECHDYKYLYYNPVSGYYWLDGTTSAKYYSIKLYRAVLSIGLNSTSFTYNGSAQGPTINSVSAKSAAASKVNKTVGSAYLPAASSFSLKYYGTTATGAKYGDSSSPKTAAPTEVGNYYVRVVLNNTNSYRTNFTLNEAYAAPTFDTNTTGVYQRDYAFTITYGDITTYSATGLNGTYNGSPQSLITAYSATTNFTQTWTFSTTSATSGFSAAVPTATNAGSYTVWCKVSVPYYNDRVFSTTATIGKKNLTISWNPSGTGAASYTYNGGGQGPTASFIGLIAGQNYSPTVYYNGSTTKPTAVGSYTASVNNTAPSANYTVTASNKPFTINKANIASVSITVYNGVYDGAAHNAITNYSAKTVGNQAQTWYWGTSSNPTSTAIPKLTNYTAGTRIYYKITSPNHNDYTGSVVAKVNKKNLTVVWNPAGTGTASYTYNGSPQGPTATYSGLISGQNYSPTVYYNGSTTKPTNAGSYTASVNNTAPSANYTVTASTKPFTINGMAITSVSVTPYSGVYDGVAREAVTSYSAATVGGESATWYWGTSSNPTSTTIPKVTNATTGTTVYYKVTAPNHSDYNGSVKYTIARRDLSKTANTYSEISAFTFSGNENKPTPTVTKVGNVSVTSTGMFSYAYKDNVNTGTAIVTVTGLESGNYTGSYDLTFTIEKAVITGVEWDKLAFTYNGSEQCPALSKINTATNVISSAKPISMFEITGGQVNAGTHTVTATLKPDFAKNFTTSSTDKDGTQCKQAYNIGKAYLELSFGNVKFTYTGLSQQPTYSLTTNSGCDIAGVLEISLQALDSSYLTDGSAVDAGKYKILVTMPEEVCLNYAKRVDGATATDTSWTADFEISACKLKAEWSGTEFNYNGAKQAPELTNFVGKPEHGADPFIGLTVTYYGVNGELTGKPVHAGDYSVAASLTNRNYALDGGAEQSFKIKSVSFADNGGHLNWNDLGGLIFTGLAQGPELNGEHNGVFTADSGRALVLTLTYAMADGAGNATGEFTTEKFTNAGKYLVRVTESYGDYTFADEAFEIAKREVTVNWQGDSLSRLDGEVYKWLYDGEKHAPDYTVEFVGGADIYRDGAVIDTLEITYGSLTNVGTLTLEAKLAEDSYNANFEITSSSKTQDIEIEKFTANKVEWYEQGASDPLTAEELESLHYEYSKVYGKDGPKLVAKAITTYNTDESGEITRAIDLAVTYPTYYEGYWEVRDEKYKAVADYKSADSANCGFAESVLTDDNGVKRVLVKFLVTELRTDLEKLTVVWVIDVNGTETNITKIGAFDSAVGYGWLNGEFTFVYNGTAQYPVPKAMGEYNNRVSVTLGESGKHSDVGTGYTVYMKPVRGYEIAEGASECRYGIAPREITVTWTGADSYVFGDDPVQRLTASVDGGSISGLLEDDVLKVTIDGLNAGSHRAEAAVYTDGKPNANYKLTGASKSIEITRKPISVTQIDWSKTLESGASEALDGAGNKYYVFPNDGNSHVPTAELKVYVGAEEKTIGLTVMGAASATGSYTAYAILDTSDYNLNFVLVVSEFAAELKETIASQKFEISKIAITSIVWTATEDSEAAEEIAYEYDGKTHKPYAVGETTDGRKFTLSVWGEQVNAGEYVAYVTDNYTYETGAERTLAFTINPKKVTVEWQAKDENGEIHFTYDGTEKHPEVKVGGGLTEDDYIVTGFVNAGSYVSTITFLNSNYTYDNTASEEANVCEFIIDKREISIGWTGAGNYTPAAAETGVMYWRYNGEPRGPVASGSFGNVRFGEDAENRIIVSGREINAGSYIATATLDTTVAANANYTLTNTTKRFVITPYEIRVIWTGNEAAEGAFEWEYDGLSHNPTARYKLWNSAEDEWIYPGILGAKVNAGEYVASVELPENCTFEKIGGRSSGEQAFTISKRKVTKINWYSSAEETAEDITDIKGFGYEYNGLPQVPVARVEGTGAELTVTGARINAGAGYIATAALKDGGNYILGADVNATYTFGITPKAVMVLWADNSDKGAFTWTYTGNLICPTAEFEDVDGNKVGITVTGGRINVGAYTATAHDTFLNYDFSTEDGNLTERNFRIEALDLGGDFEWLANGGEFTPAADDESLDKYTFVYNGSVQQPVAHCANADIDIFFAYTIKCAGEEVGAIINAGTYTLTVRASDVNYDIPVKTVTVVIKPMEVTAVWGNTKLEYTGVSQAPTAHYVDVNGQCIALAVSGAKTEAGNGYKATAEFETTDNKLGNYVLVAEDIETLYDIKSKATASFKWDWATGKFIYV